ncbi:ATP-binding protein [Tautonia plasticadhaerens]|uniref:histidine kinase n=1 Tax=Tautonia plasticadhaerens TaxID=2527974 RepID=A0A518HBJ9_9BACT|nr:ATP-binding protein [Tautonia plasticadhaerens]QDV38229.1 Autoinducer 2 sensor kinase/phosphatase LuxQ [Tautonia plasticadhaerens]
MSQLLQAGPSLTMVEGPMAGLSYGLRRPSAVVGRDPRCDVVLPFASVSRRHARISRRDDGFVLEDLGSTGGTLLNGEAILGPSPLRDGDRIGVGGFLLSFSGPQVVPNPWIPGTPAILSERETTETGEMALIGVQAEQKLAAILEISRGLAGALDLGDVLEKALDALFSVFPAAERGLVLLEGGGGGGIAPTAFKLRDGAQVAPAVSRTIMEYVLSKGRAILSVDVTTDDRFVDSKSAAEARIRTLMCAPLRDSERRPVGILQLDTSDPHARFTGDDLDLLVAVAGQVTLAVNNARLLERLHEEHRRLVFLAEVGDRLGASLDVEEMLRGVAELSVPRLADLCLVDLLDRDGAIRRVAAVHADPAKHSMAAELLRRDPPDQAGADPVAVALRSGRVESGGLADAGGAGASRPGGGGRSSPLGMGIGSWVCVPLVARGRTLGVVSFVVGEGRHPLGPDDRLAAELMSRRVALAVDNARLYQEAEAASRAKDRFLAVLSHELRTPLTPILLAASAMLEEDEAPTRSTLEMIRRNVALEVRLIDDLLDVVRIGRGELDLKMEVVDVHDVLGRAAEICREEVSASGLAVEFELAAASHHVRADPARLLQVAWNLVCNATKFTPPGGTLTIRSSDGPPAEAGRPPVTLVVEFRDTGPGIEPALLRRIFEPFEQGSPGLRGRAAGMGLGLAISRAIVEAHGGRLTAQSGGRGQGTTFRIELSPVPFPGRAEGSTSTAPRPGPGGVGMRLLLVEDNGDTLRFLSMALRRRDFDVVEAGSLAEARAALARSRFDLLLSDIELPDGTGLELMREAIAAGTTAGLAMSGYGSDEDVQQSRAAGFAEHLTKPVDLRTLEEAIRRVARPDGRTGPA